MLKDKEQRIKFDSIVSELRSMDIDGESLQELLQELGMEEQMLRQLVMSCSFPRLDEFITEKVKIELPDFLNRTFKVIKTEHGNRMELLSDDIDTIFQWGIGGIRAVCMLHKIPYDSRVVNSWFNQVKNVDN